MKSRSCQCNNLNNISTIKEKFKHYIKKYKKSFYIPFYVNNLIQLPKIGYLKFLDNLKF